MQHGSARRRFSALFIGIVVCLIAIAVGIWRVVRQNRLDRALLSAAHWNAAAEIDALLREGADPNVCDPVRPAPTWRDTLRRCFRHSPLPRTDSVLLIATQHGNLAAVQRLLAAGAQVNAANSSLQTALTVAFDEGRLDIMLTLLAHGADPNVTLPNSQDAPVPLLIAAFQFEAHPSSETAIPTLVKSLLDHGADVHAVDSDGMSALMEALERNHAECVEWLVRRGADLNRFSRWQGTPLSLAANYEGDATNLETLLRGGADVSPARNRGWNILCWAAEEDRVSIANEVLQRGLSVNSRDRQGRTPLMYAAANGADRAAALLLAKGAAVDARDNLGWTALMFAAQNNNLRMVEALLQHGADRSLRDAEDHWTAEERARHVGQDLVAARLKGGLLPQEHKREPASPLFGWKNDRSEQSWRKRVDAQRQIRSVSWPVLRDEEDMEDPKFAVVVVDGHGRPGRPFRDDWTFRPEVEVFRDTDGTPYGFLRGHHRTEPAVIVAIRGQDLIKECDYYSEYGNGKFCQPLAGGGALIISFDRAQSNEGELLEGLRVAHVHDRVAEVFRFRNGKSTRLGLILLPGQED